ncbi:YnjH family protein [Erwinia mallotivora]|uniref:YnjH family protein n=1 Tax=Erwinia mallotivora TaxID=69222 RepID=UPI0021BF467E|nr:YnjH family protein [Erwinia mallotivora]
MIKKSATLLGVLLLCSQPSWATEQYGGQQNSADDSVSAYDNSTGRGSGVVIDMPPQVWTQNQNSNNNQPPCQRCCIWQNRSYTEGSVVKMEGVLLQCARDEQSFGTNNLIWKPLKQ